MEGKEYYQFLFQRYAKGLASDSEQQELFDELVKTDAHAWEEMIQDHIISSNDVEYDEKRWETIIQTILLQRRKSAVRRMPGLVRFAAAAVFILIAGAAIYLLPHRTTTASSGEGITNAAVPQDLAPGGDKAVLTLADGRTIVLDSAADGAITKQGGITIIKVGGQLTYDQQVKTTEVLYNTITTPRGGQYQLELADGTKVWLNAASSLRFPTAFTGNNRRVELTGEGYFEVAHNAQKPFHVQVRRQAQNDDPMDVEVMGTHFNINGYENEPMVKTTLLEGKVKVMKGERSVVLSPGQQAVANPSRGDLTVISDVDVEGVVAWKNGLISFDGADVGEVMRQIARWYDVEVAYDRNVQSAHVSGKISRSLNLSEVIRVLEESGIDIKKEGRKLIAVAK